MIFNHRPCHLSADKVGIKIGFFFQPLTGPPVGGRCQVLVDFEDLSASKGPDSVK
jgi:hypothetical protein